MITKKQYQAIINNLQSKESIAEFRACAEHTEDILIILNMRSEKIQPSVMDSLIKEFKSLKNVDKSVEVKSKVNKSGLPYIEVKYYVSDGCNGDWSEVDIYSHWAFEQLVKWMKKNEN